MNEVSNEHKLLGALHRSPSGESKKSLSSCIGVSVNQLVDVVNQAQAILRETPWTLIESETEIKLALDKATSSVLDAAEKEEADRELTPAQLETVSIIAYGKGISKPELDYIRGVNSKGMIRTLLMRGLIESVKQSERPTTYVPTADLLAHLGLTSTDELESGKELSEIITKFREEKEEHEEA